MKKYNKENRKRKLNWYYENHSSRLKYNKDNAERKIWLGIIYRCTKPTSPSWKIYGGRGIRVCERWLNSFNSFLSDMGKRPSNNHSIDRINNNGNYEPKNCRWATKKEQANNRPFANQWTGKYYK